ncbi:hypothetical protein CP532_6134 [Ophiocordyceps camponoti-leonardi (nom. inval.)]|nr:hypothetical protein CP532_6134 [Ophiocordyceps camponoti-leonardi (nom. inval.)]
MLELVGFASLGRRILRRISFLGSGERRLMCALLPELSTNKLPVSEAVDARDGDISSLSWRLQLIPFLDLRLLSLFPIASRLHVCEGSAFRKSNKYLSNGSRPSFARPNIVITDGSGRISSANITYAACRLLLSVNSASALVLGRNASA